jgi:hypothetical protein
METFRWLKVFYDFFEKWQNTWISGNSLETTLVIINMQVRFKKVDYLSVYLK